MAAIETLENRSDDAPVGKVVKIQPSQAEIDLEGFLRRRRVTDNLLRWVTPMVLILLWQFAATSGLLDQRFWPAPTEVLQEALDLIEAGALQTAMLTTIRRVLIGYVLGAVAGILVGLFLGAFRTARVALEPVLHALYTVPKLALLPLLLLVFGLGESPIIILIAVTVFFFASIPTTAAVIAVPTAYLEASRSFGGSRFQEFRSVILPAVLPALIVALRLCAGISILVVVGVEFVHGGAGLGFLIWNSWQLFVAPRMYVGIVVVAVMGVIFQAVVAAAGRRLAPWADHDASTVL